ncbi:hypothetical protein [Saccharothrix yanglingensis]|uniref:hypothetical protein n=1 Tax=Saccharothrix yanglingensis TaxID=659496 RepID=UPI0027D3222A|nr:hypothetical protein [Saccharothrix yanglingensis]
MRSTLSFQLHVIDDDLGALNLCSRHVDAFTEQPEPGGAERCRADPELLRPTPWTTT